MKLRPYKTSNEVGLDNRERAFAEISLDLCEPGVATAFAHAAAAAAPSARPRPVSESSLDNAPTGAAHSPVGVDDSQSGTCATTDTSNLASVIVAFLHEIVHH